VAARDTPFGQLQARVDGREGRPQLVRGDGDELLAQPQRRLDDALLLRDVTRDRRRADDPAFAVADRRDRHRDLDPLAALAHSDGLVVVDALASAQAGEDPGNLVGALLRHDDRDQTPDRLVRGVAVDALRPGVPADDRAVKRLADDRVVRRIDDRREVVRRPGGQTLRLALYGVDRR